MKKEYYNREKANYINKRLRSTSINKVYLPLVTDVMLRRLFEYGLSDEMLDRDINTFIENVENIRIVEPTLLGELGGFNPQNKEITLYAQIFREKTTDYEKFYETFTHECIHAINLEQTRVGKKEDRVFKEDNFQFSTQSAMEAFTESIANEQVKNREYNEFQTTPYISETTGYKWITPYVDVISATFGVSRKELLSATVKGEGELNKLLNKSMNTTYESLGGNGILYGLVTNIYLQDCEISKERKLLRDESICSLAMRGINERLSKIEIADIDAFRKEFEQIKLEADIICLITGNQKYENIDYDSLEFERKFFEEYKDVYNYENENINYNKLKCIEVVLKNDSILDKIELLRNIQSVNSMDELTQLMEGNNITIDSDMRLAVAPEIIREHNMEYSSNGMEWDNTQIIEYIQKNQERIINPKNNILERISTKIKSWIGNFGRTKNEEIKLLPGDSKSDEVSQKPWDLSNWGIDKEQFMEGHAQDMEEYWNKPQVEPTIEQPMQEQGFTMHSGHEEGFVR